MKKISARVFSFLLVLAIAVSMIPMAWASGSDPEVQAVIAQLEAIDTLQEMQNKRSAYAVKSRYDAETTNAAIISAHEAARVKYLTYLEEMRTARTAAQQAYDALSDAQKAQVPAELAAKLSEYLPNKFNAVSFPIKAGSAPYIYQTVDNPNDRGVVYEVSNEGTLGKEQPCLFILADTTLGGTSLTPNGIYQPGVSNYIVGYCCDHETDYIWSDESTDNFVYYRRTNLEDAGYISQASADKIRGIMLNSYPFVSIEQMKSNLISMGLSADFVNSLTKSDILYGVQVAVWIYANNINTAIDDRLYYGMTYDVPVNASQWMNPIHDFTNELWGWWTTAKSQYSYSAEDEYRVDSLVYYLCTLMPSVKATPETTVIGDIDVTRADLVPNGDGTYAVGMHIKLSTGAKSGDSLKLVATSYHDNGDGTRSITGATSTVVGESDTYSMYVKAKPGDTIEVVVEGTQNLGRGVYFYEAEGGRKASQSVVGVGEGNTPVRTVEKFSFKDDIEQGLRIYKTVKDSGEPISDITFHVYKVEASEGDVLNSTPTAEEVAKYAVPENLVGSVVTDVTGYAALELETGRYMVVEEFNAEKIKAPVEPFYILIPMPEEILTLDEEGNEVTEIIYHDVAQVYPKNEPVPPPPPPPPPPPESLYGKLSIVKHEKGDTAAVLEGAEFEVYRKALEGETAATTIVCGGAEIPVVEALDRYGNNFSLKSNENGYAVSPELRCGTYYVVETKAPAGYSLLEEAVVVVVTPDSAGIVETTYIANERGTILPETGGVGTTVMLGVGAVIFIAAAIVLVSRKRMAGAGEADPDIW